jgi:hypothetical protein
LESGKTKFIQETLEDERFDTGESTLLLVMEEGEEEYDESRFKVQNVHISYLNGKDELTEANLASLQEMYGATRVLVEYNGMWLLQDFFKAMPEGWMINQLMAFFDARTVLNFNANMRQLVFDKIENAQLVVFNRYSDDMDKMALHKLVRGISRRSDVVYERTNGKADFDDIEDPLPFDIHAEVIVIEDKDYAYFYRDLTENLEEYVGKTIHFKGIVATDKRLPEGNIVIGRHVMTCCEDDIAFSGLAAVLPVKMDVQTRDWLEITAKIELKKHYVYKGKGPVLAVSEVKRCEPLEQALAVFY